MWAFFKTRSNEHYTVHPKTEEQSREISEYEVGFVLFDNVFVCNQNVKDPLFLQEHDITM